MKLLRSACAAVLVAAGVSTSLPAEGAEPPPGGEAVAKLGSLLPRMAEGDGNALNEFQTACFQAARPGAEEERAELCRAVAEKLGPATKKSVRVHLLRQLEHVGRGEVVDALSRALGDEDALIREHARRALQNNPSPEAARVLRGALERADSDETRIAFVNALGYRRDPDSVRAIAGLVRRGSMVGSSEARIAACEALARAGDRSSVRILEDAMRSSTGRAKRIATDAYLLLADRLAEEGDKSTAREMYRKLMGSEGHLKCAAIVGLGRSGGDEGFEIVLKALSDEDPEVRGAAVGALEVIPTEDLVLAAEEKLRGADPEFKAGLLRVLARRADRGMASMFVAAAKDADRTVRLVALEALGKVGDASAVPLLARAAAEGSKDERPVARRSLGVLADVPGGEDVDLAIVAELRGASREVRIELIRSLAARGAKAAVPELLTAARDADDSVRAESLKALAALAAGDDLPSLVDIVVRPRAEGDRAEAEKAVLAACRRAGDPLAAAEPLLDALRGAPVAARLSLLKVLGKIGGPGALAAVRSAIRDRDASVKDAAVRALCDWPTADAADELHSIVRSARNQIHSVLAFRGFVRLAGLEAAGDVDYRVSMYQEAMRIAPRKEDKKLVLAGLGDLSDIRSLDMVAPYLDDNALRSEAASAVARIARGIAGSHKTEAMSALNKVIAVARNNDVRRQAQEAINIIERYEDYVTAWKVSGPYTIKDKRGKQGGHLLDVMMPPEVVEAPGAKPAEWKPWTGSGDRPWFVDFNRLFRGDNRVAYLRAQIYSPNRQQARLEIGSDDGVKVWLNHKVVHNNKASRGLQEGEDKVKVTLEEGWNRIVLKIQNGGGDWAACMRVRAADGSKLEGLRTKAE